ncbi:3'-5' ssDNA/RNA exonuclease TatD-like [Ostrea edulis]|uniref:3'-5' ssDNA/RNA exonuclease TatD-like n=1 Tax=Ostrea edulis TaxID=37623 RepID=UPI0024AF530E|nr:3'-5' ssDNA/RNA exonuclease TatD-like [Ostrea edulis]
MYLLDNCSLSSQESFAKFTSEVPHLQPRDQETTLDRPVVVASTAVYPETQTVIEELVMEEVVMVDETSTDEREATGHSCVPAVFDSHFHLDRTCRVILGHDEGHTVEDLIEFSVSEQVAYKPAFPVKVVGGIIVYSEPRTYPDNAFNLQGTWRVAVGVHPKHYHTLTLEKAMKLQQLLDHPQVVALGECELDRTISPTEWLQQEEVFIKMLRLTKPTQPLVLHLRGPAGDVYGSDVHCRCMMLMEKLCSRDQRIHVHCFMGTTDIVEFWLKKFPNVYFGITAAIRYFNNDQLTGLKAFPRSKLLLETDVPYFPLGTSLVSTPAYLGETAAFVAVHLDMRPPDLLQLTLNNSRRLYLI